jgi:hypothetical protein
VGGAQGDLREAEKTLPNFSSETLTNLPEPDAGGGSAYQWRYSPYRQFAIRDECAPHMDQLHIEAPPNQTWQE